MTLLNLLLLFIDLMAFLGLSVLYIVCTKRYYSYYVPRINTCNVVISGREIEVFINKLKNIYNLQDYEIVYDNTSRFVRLFKNIKKNNRIVISKKIFESVGYEIDYIASRIWISQKKINKNYDLWSYKLTLKFVPWLLVILMFITLVFNFFVFIYMYGGVELNQHKAYFFQILWRIPLVTLVFVGLFSLLILNYLLSTKIKVKIENKYTKEMSKIINEHFDEYKLDFEAARVYAISIKLSYLPIYKPNNFWETSNWVGPFVYI